MVLDQDIVDRVTAASVGAQSLHELTERLAVDASERESPVGYLAVAFSYLDTHPGPARVAVGDFFKPMMEIGGERTPPALADIGHEIVEVWLAGADQITAPLPRARLNDLCFEGDFGNRGKHGVEAANAYLAAARELAAMVSADGSRAWTTHLDTLSRAHLLALTLSNDELRTKVADAVLSAVRLYVDADDAGAVMMFAELLVNDRPPVRGLPEALESIRKALADDAHATERTVRVQLELPALDDKTRIGYQRDLVDAIARQADAMEGIARVHHLERAIGVARDAAQQDLVDDLTRQLQSIPKEELELSAFTYNFSIPREKVDEWIAGYTNQPTWQHALVRMVIGNPPSGNVDENRDTAERNAREHPLQWLFTRVRVGGDGLPRFTPQTPDDTREMQLTQVEENALASAGFFLPRLIQSIWSKWAPIGEDELATFFGEAPHIDEALASAIARNFRRFCAGDHEGAAYAAAAHIEAAARGLVIAINAPAYRVQRAHVQGQYVGLGALIGILERGDLDPSWCRFFRTFLAGNVGFNHRNELLHGFNLEPSDASAALSFVALLYLTKIVGAGPPTPNDDPGQHA